MDQFLRPHKRVAMVVAPCFHIAAAEVSAPEAARTSIEVGRPFSVRPFHSRSVILNGQLIPEDTKQDRQDGARRDNEPNESASAWWGWFFIHCALPVFRNTGPAVPAGRSRLASHTHRVRHSRPCVTTPFSQQHSDQRLAVAEVCRLASEFESTPRRFGTVRCRPRFSRRRDNMARQLRDIDLQNTGLHLTIRRS